MGEAKFGLGNYFEANKWGQRALKEKWKTIDVYLLLGKVSYQMHQCKDAKLYFHKVLDVDSSNAVARKRIADCS